MLTSFGGSFRAGRRKGRITIYGFTSHTFTTGGYSSRKDGPTLSALRSAYSSAAWAQDNLYFSMPWHNGIQVWTVPETGTYRIQSAGAGHIGYTYAWGGIVEAEFALTVNTQLAILVGQRGSDTNQGCGASFVAVYNSSVPASSTALIVGGGAGSLYSSGDVPETAAYVAGPGKWSVGSYSWNDGDGAWGFDGGAGGGFNSSGNTNSGNSGASGTPGSGFKQGGVGGERNDTSQGQGGFGGGGAYHSGRNGGGGGGGYSGGLGGRADGSPYTGVGLGGSCYIAGSGASLKSTSNLYPGSISSLSANRGEGYVTITRV